MKIEIHMSNFVGMPKNIEAMDINTIHGTYRIEALSSTYHHGNPEERDTKDCLDKCVLSDFDVYFVDDPDGDGITLTDIYSVLGDTQDEFVHSIIDVVVYGETEHMLDDKHVELTHIRTVIVFGDNRVINLDDTGKYKLEVCVKHVRSVHEYGGSLHG